MIGEIIHWMSTVPLENPMRALLILVELFTFAFILHILWELAFTLVNKFKHSSSKPSVTADVYNPHPK